MVAGDEGTEVGGRIHGIPDSDIVPGTSQQPRHEGGVDPLLHIDASAIGAHLALGIEVRHHGGADRLLQIRIVEDDEGGLASQLHGHSLEGVCGGAHHLLAGAHLAGEGDLGHLGCLTQPGPDPAIPLHHVEDTGGHAGLDEDLRQLEGAKGRLLRGFEDHAVAAGQRRGCLPAGNLQRVVPGADPGADAQGLAAAVVKIGPQLLLIALDGGGKTGEELYAVSTGHHVHHGGLLPGLAGVGHLDGGQGVVALAQQGNGPQQDPATFDPAHGRPKGKTLLGTRNGGSLHGLIGHLDLVDDGPGSRIDHLEALARGIGQVTAVDKILITGQRHEFTPLGSVVAG